MFPRRLELSWLGTPVKLTFLMLVTGYAIYLAIVLNHRDAYYTFWDLFPSLHWHFLTWVFSHPFGLSILALGVAGLIAGIARNEGSKALVQKQMSVAMLPSHDAMTQRVAALATKLDIPAPEVGLVAVSNAFAVGSSRKNSMVVLGTPLTRTLTDDELNAVIGHELGHIVTNDMQRMQVGEGYQMLMGQLVNIVRIIGIIGAASYGKRDMVRLVDGLGNLGRMTVFLGGELLLMGLSRKREYYADAIGAALTSPHTMISCLEKIHAVREPLSDEETMFKCMMFRSSFMGGLLSTHPTLESRKRALQSGVYLKRLQEGGRTAMFLKWATPYARRGALAGLKHGTVAAKAAREQLTQLGNEGYTKLKNLERPHTPTWHPSSPDMFRAPDDPYLVEPDRGPLPRPADRRSYPQNLPIEDYPKSQWSVPEPERVQPYERPALPRHQAPTRSWTWLSLIGWALLGLVALVAGAMMSLVWDGTCSLSGCFSPSARQMMTAVTGLPKAPYTLDYPIMIGGQEIGTHRVQFKIHAARGCTLDVERTDTPDMRLGFQPTSYGPENGRVVFDFRKAESLKLERTTAFEQGMHEMFSTRKTGKNDYQVLAVKVLGEGAACTVGTVGACQMVTIWERPLEPGLEDRMNQAFNNLAARCRN